MTTTSTPARVARRLRPQWQLFLGIATGSLAGVLVGLALTTLAMPMGMDSAGTAVIIGLPLARTTLDLAALTTIGLAMLPWLVGANTSRRGRSVLAKARRFSAASAAVWIIAALTSLVFETADEYAGQSISLGLIGRYVGQISSGQALLIVAGCALAYLVLAVSAVRKPDKVPVELRITVAAFALLPLPLTGHAGDAPGNWHDISMISMELHVLGAVAWTGGLLATVLLAVRDRELLAVALPNYSKVATICVFLVAATGTLNGLLQLYLTPGVHWYLAVFTTGYGQIMLCKAGCLLIAALLGAHIRFKLLPAIARRARTAVLQWASVELTLMGLAFGLAAVLVRAPVIS
ncbi:MAG TPA: CopD family protein [Pseudonocardiaceae bacterium]|nr:CopD family protein [Pseudonocardiaceae bacterium]